MNMEDFHCDTLNMSFNFGADAFDKTGFLKGFDIQDESKLKDEDGDLILRLSLPSKKDIKKQHGHLTVLIRPDTTGRINLDFHRAGTRKVKKEPPYLEDAAKWLSRFFAEKEFTATLALNYEFDKTFEPTIPLPFPLVAESKKLSGLKVSGLSLEYPDESEVATAIIEAQSSTGPWVFLQEVTLVNLETFDVYKELRKLQNTITSLVRKRGNHETKSRKTKKA